MAVQGGEMRPDRRLQPLARRSALLRRQSRDRRLVHEAHAVIDHRLDDLLLRGEVVVEARLADADRLGDLAKRGLVIAAIAQQPRGMIEDQAARAAFGFAGRALGHGGHNEHPAVMLALVPSIHVLNTAFGRQRRGWSAQGRP
ncbi:hypothetical protein BTHI11S_02479 [Bosea thiooxidans]